MKRPTNWTRGGLTAIAGIALITIALIAEILGSIGISDHLDLTLIRTWNPMPAPAVFYVYTLSALAILLGALGVLLIGLARPERDQEEENLLDPTRYPPWRFPWKSTVPLLALVVGFLLFATLSSVPVAHAFTATIPVGVCGENPSNYTIGVTLPSGALLTYTWRTSNGFPVSEMAAPTGPNVTSFWSAPEEYVNSSGGSGFINSGGYTVGFLACDFASSPTSGLASQVYLTGTYYDTIVEI
jgi:hypothetical protein